MAQPNENQVEFDRMQQWFVDNEFQEVEWWQHPDDDWRQEHAPQGYFDNEDQRVQDYVAECQRIRGIIEVVRNSDLFEPFRNTIGNLAQNVQNDPNAEHNEQDKYVVLTFFVQFPDIVSDLENFRGYIQRMAPTLSSRQFGAIDVNARHETLLTIDNMNEIFDMVSLGRNLANLFKYQRVGQWFFDRQWVEVAWFGHNEDEAWRVAHAPAGYFANEPHTIANFVQWCLNVRQGIYNIWNTIEFQEFRNALTNVRVSNENNAPVNAQDVLALRNYFNQFPDTLKYYRQVRLDFENKLRQIVPTLSSMAFTEIDNSARNEALRAKLQLDMHIILLDRAHQFQLPQEELHEVHQWFVDCGWIPPDQERWWADHPLRNQYRMLNAPANYWQNENQLVQTYRQICTNIRNAINHMRNNNNYIQFRNSYGNYLASINNDAPVHDEDVEGMVNFFSRFPTIFPRVQEIHNVFNTMTQRLAPTLSSTAFAPIDTGARHEALQTGEPLYDLYNDLRDARGRVHQLIHQMAEQWFTNRGWEEVGWFHEQPNAVYWRAVMAPPAYFPYQIQNVEEYRQFCNNIRENINNLMNGNDFQLFRNSFANYVASRENDAPIHPDDVLGIRHFMIDLFPHILQEWEQVQRNFEERSKYNAATLSSTEFGLMDINARWEWYKTRKALNELITLFQRARDYANQIQEP